MASQSQSRQTRLVDRQLNPPPSRPGLILFAAFVLLPAGAASGQITYISRNGAYLAGCGPVSGGPAQSVSFSTPDTTTPQSLSVSHPGPPLSSASVTYDATALPGVFSLSQSGSASRGAPSGSIAAVADCREFWQFFVSVPVCFSLTASINVSVSTPGDAVTSFLFGGAPGQITLADGSVVQSIGHNITSGNGQFDGAWSGVLSPGQFSTSFNHRVNAVGFPFTGSFDGQVTLTLSPIAPVCSLDCDDIDFNNDGLFPDTQDIDDFLSVFSGGACLQ